MTDKMLYVVSGGSGSGKSEYAEQMAVHVFENLYGKERARREDGVGTLYYVATMEPYDEESHARIARHRRMRQGRGFVTLECPCRLETLQACAGDVLLLEDLSNLLANERYLEEGRIRGSGRLARQQAAEAILEPLLALSRAAGSVVVVTNDIFSDGTVYEPETEEYRGLLGFLNAALAEAADGVAEVVCAIALCRKGELPC